MLLNKWQTTSKNSNNYLLVLPSIFLVLMASSKAVYLQGLSSSCNLMAPGAEIISKSTSVKCLEADSFYKLRSHWEFSEHYMLEVPDIFICLGLRHTMAAGFQRWVLHLSTSLKNHTDRPHIKIILTSSPFPRLLIPAQHPTVKTELGKYNFWLINEVNVLISIIIFA